MSVRWEITCEQKPGLNHLVEANTHKEMIDKLKERGFKRVLADGIPYQIPPLQPDVMEDLWFKKDGLEINAEFYWRMATPIDNMPTCDEMVEMIRRNDR